MINVANPFCVSITWLYVAGCGVTDLYKEVTAMSSLSIVVGHGVPFCTWKVGMVTRKIIIC